MYLVPCKKCGNGNNFNAKTCPKCGAVTISPKNQPALWPFWNKVILMFIVFMLVLVIVNSNLTPEEQAQRKEEQAQRKEEQAKLAIQREAKDKEEAVLRVKKNAERRKKGFHCLSDWDGSHRRVKTFIEGRLRDPDSFEHVETKITPMDADGNHTLFMTYRAKNGFGGVNVETAIATVKNSNCAATIQ